MGEERWREIAGPVGRIEPGPAERDHRRARACGSATRRPRAASAPGVTVVAPPSLPALAGVATINGVGELTAKLEIDERGVIETPVYLCGSHAVGHRLPGRGAGLRAGGPTTSCCPVVGECDDGEMADSRTVTSGDVERALEHLGRRGRRRAASGRARA